jgi:hypothetical protein
VERSSSVVAALGTVNLENCPEMNWNLENLEKLMWSTTTCSKISGNLRNIAILSRMTMTMLESVKFYRENDHKNRNLRQCGPDQFNLKLTIFRLN